MLARPLTGMVLVNRAERAADALALLASQNPAVLRLLKGIAGASMYAELAFIVGDVVIAAGVEQGAIPVEHPLAHNIRQEIVIVQEMVQKQVAQQQAAAQTVESESPQSV